MLKEKRKPAHLEMLKFRQSHAPHERVPHPHLPNLNTPSFRTHAKLKKKMPTSKTKPFVVLLSDHNLKGVKQCDIELPGKPRAILLCGRLYFLLSLPFHLRCDHTM